MTDVTQEIRVSPGGGQMAERWRSDLRATWSSWTLRGGTDDGAVVEDAEVADWTPLMPVQPLVITEDVLDVVGPVVVLGVVLTALRAQLEELEDAAEVVRELRSPAWDVWARQLMLEDLNGELGRVQEVLDRISAAVADQPLADEDEEQD